MMRMTALLFPLLFLSGCYTYVHETRYVDPYGPATLVIHNDEASYGTVWYAYAVPSSATDWGEELLGDEVLYPGDELVVDIYACDQYYDLRVEYDDATVIEKTGVWLPCDTTTVALFLD